MKIFFSSGLLGNQLFQLGAAQKIAEKNERLVLFGFGEALEVIDLASVNRKVVSFVRLRHGSAIRRFISRNIYKALRVIGLFLQRVGIIGEIREQPQGPAEFPGLTKTSASIDTHFRKSIIETPLDFRLSENRAIQARGWLQGLGVRFSSENVASATFLHVRRTDYLTWPNSDFPAYLEAGWFDEALKVSERINPEFPVIVFSDDFDWVRLHWDESDRVLFCDSTFDKSFPIMSLCASGILSPSTYSWWAAKLNIEKKPGPFIAPDYWAGHRAGRWVGYDFKKSPFLTFL